MNHVKKICLIDDDAEDQQMFSDTLHSINSSIELISFSDGKQALKTLIKESRMPDFIFLDLNLPMANGFEVLREIKKNSKLKNIPVIIYTTSSERKHKEETAKLGASSFITKPSDLTELKKLLQRQLQDSPG